ncbi:MAG: hypothetical protein A3H98_03865 [Bacteroidetes bacterium RIFCSPLOWO2_02_FULL_36_8]|nr:MAG: hypothetical protein A3H98_03865 [Bacteroidetes bacterium RIFCSPLOWO2_02_FULL_36_8]OFY71906.1 MAG: hypothetical protein A3G23_05125 [Bacteroidetes bacterium RIFCSPLOWO2_12_FULL_37_12]
MKYKSFFSIFIFSFFFLSAFAQKSTIQSEVLKEREFHKYEILIRQAERHSERIMSAIDKPDVTGYFDQLYEYYDTTTLHNYFIHLNESCNLSKRICAYIGFFLEDNNTYFKKMVHCVYECEMECGTFYFMFSYFLENNKIALQRFIRKPIGKQDDIILNVIKRNP